MGPSPPDDRTPYGEYNKACRTRDLSAVQRWQEFSFHFVQGLSKLPDVVKTVFRGLNIPLSALSDIYSKNNKVWWNQVTSCSTDPTKLSEFAPGVAGGTFIKIEAKRAKSISQLSVFPFEHEVLLLPDTAFLVLNFQTATEIAQLRSMDVKCPAGKDLVVMKEV